MQLTLHSSTQETTSGNTAAIMEPNLSIRSIIVDVTQISVNLFGNITFKIQHSADEMNWFDVPSLGSGNITTTGSVIISLSQDFPTFQYIRMSWTFTNANSVTFSGYILGAN